MFPAVTTYSPTISGETALPEGELGLLWIFSQYAARYKTKLPARLLLTSATASLITVRYASLYLLGFSDNARGTGAVKCDKTVCVECQQ
jgi:hypothetical protein